VIYAEHCAPPYRFRQGSVPLVVSIPHCGTWIPPSLSRDMTDAALLRADTDWHLPQLYDFLGGLGASVIASTHSRYVVDLNRPPDDVNPYPGKDTTSLCPIDTFDKQPIYRAGNTPALKAILARVERYWLPYHRRLAGELARVRREHGVAVLWDAHSIVSVAPRFFPGKLTDFNLGTGGGASCNEVLSGRLLAALGRHREFRTVLNGRFIGGHITRHYGRPADNIHAVQMEMTQANYMDEHSPFTFREDLAARVRPLLREQLKIALDWAQGQARTPPAKTV
jgi:N-formylglutamate deformylase